MCDKFVIHPKRKPPSHTSVISLRLSDLTLDKLEVIVEKSGYSRNEIISMCIDFALDNLEIKYENSEESE